MAGTGERRHDRAFKVAALDRMAAGEDVGALGRELGARRKLLYRWRDTVRRGGAEALSGVGRPPAGARLTTLVERMPPAAPCGVAVPGELTRARARIAELERKVGQQALEPDFFGQALQLMNEAGRRPSVPYDAPVSPASSRPLRGLRAAALAGADDPAAAGSGRGGRAG